MIYVQLADGEAAQELIAEEHDLTAKLEPTIDERQDKVARVEAERDNEKKAHAVTKGKLTKMTKRADRPGLCAVAGFIKGPSHTARGVCDAPSPWSQRQNNPPDVTARRGADTKPRNDRETCDCEPSGARDV